MEKLTYITSNPEKAEEAKILLPGAEWLKLNLSEIQSLDSQEIIGFKLVQAVSQLPDANQRILLVEDVSLVFNNCNGLPGPLVKWFLKSVGAEGLYTFARAFNATGAQAILTVGLKVPGKKPIFFKGAVDGNIVAPRGTQKKHFGFDLIFSPAGSMKTFAEMTKAEKNAVSHRGLTLRKVREYLENTLKWQFPKI